MAPANGSMVQTQKLLKSADDTGLLNDNPTPKNPLQRPIVGSAMRQQFGLSKLQSQVRELLGVFNPKYIGFDTRLLMRQDATVSFGMAVLRAPIINARWTIESRNAKVGAFVEQELKRKYFELAMGGSQAMHFGYQPIEKVWAVKKVLVDVDDQSNETVSTFTMDQAWVIDQFKALDHRTINMLIDRDTDNWSGFEQRPVAIPISGQMPRIGTERAFLWSFRRPEVFGRLQGHPITNQMYGPWWDKSATNLFCNRYFEHKAEPPFKAHAPAQITGPDGQPMDGFAFMQSVLMALKNGEAVCLPGEVDEKGNRLVDVEFLQDDKRGDMFDSRLAYLDLQILKGAWIPDRAGSSSRGGAGIGSGEASVHYELLQKLIEQALVEWFKEVQAQVVDPMVLYNFGQDVFDQSKTRIVYSSLSDFMRSLYQTLLTQLLQADVALKDGKVVKVLEYMDAVDICKSLGVPLKASDELGPLAHDRVDPTGPGVTNMPALGPGSKKKPPMPTGLTSVQEAAWNEAFEALGYGGPGEPHRTHVVAHGKRHRMMMMGPAGMPVGSVDVQAGLAGGGQGGSGPAA